MRNKNMLAVAVTKILDINNHTRVRRGDPRGSVIGDIDGIVVPNRILGDNPSGRPQQLSGASSECWRQGPGYRRCLRLYAVRDDQRLSDAEGKRIQIGKIVKRKVDDL